MKKKHKSIKTNKQTRRESYEHLRNIKKNNIKRDDKFRFENDFMNSNGVINYWIDSWNKFRNKFLLEKK